jgi:hypothetical protein
MATLQMIRRTSRSPLDETLGVSSIGPVAASTLARVNHQPTDLDRHHVLEAVVHELDDRL